MKAIYLVRFGEPEKAFEFREVPMPGVGPNEIRIRTEAFGLNFADLSARNGRYRDCPPLPAVIGYDLVGYVDEAGERVQDLQRGDRVAALTRFGGYAEYVAVPAGAAVKIPGDLPLTFAGAIAVQYATAWYASRECVHLYEGNAALVHAAAGGVGTALVQLLKNRGVRVFGTCSSDEKAEYLRELGVDVPINYKKSDYIAAVRNVVGRRGLDAVFDSLGGTYVREGMKLLGTGGRMVCFGASTLMNAGGFSRLIRALQFGVYHPAFLLIQSKSIIGVSMLKLADSRPEVIFKCMTGVTGLMKANAIRPAGGSVYPLRELAAAHRALESRATTGKVMVRWD